MRRVIRRYVLGVSLGLLMIWVAPDFVRWWVTEKPTTITINP